MKKLSCIIPVYNVENYIEKCISSIEKQYCDEIEIIVVNDGSTDKGIEKIIKYSNIKIINKKNGGLSSARNEGIKAAKGEYIWFIDGDDYIEENAIRKILEKIKNEKSDIIYINYYKEINNKKIPIRESTSNYSLERRLFINTSACTKIFKRNFWNEHKLFFHEGIIYEDLALIPYVTLLTDNISQLEECIYIYVTRNNSIMKNKKFIEKKDDKFIALEDLKKYLQSAKLYDEYKEQYIYIVIRHLLIVYSAEIIGFKRKIYKDRFDKVNCILNDLDEKWIQNKYLNEQNILKRFFVFLFKHKMYFSCKIIINIMRGLRRI